MPATAACSIECGRHDAQSAIQTAVATIRAAVSNVALGTSELHTSESEEAPCGHLSAAPPALWLRCVLSTKVGESFEWVQPLRPFQRVSAGRVLATDESGDVKAEADGIVVLPTCAPVVGEEAYFLCEATKGAIDWEREDEGGEETDGGRGEVDRIVSLRKHPKARSEARKDISQMAL